MEPRFQDQATALFGALQNAESEDDVRAIAAKLSALQTATNPTSTGIRCSLCGSREFSVVRTTRTRGGICRRRECSACGTRITTKERPIVSADTNTAAISVGQLARSLGLLSGRPVPLPLTPKN